LAFIPALRWNRIFPIRAGRQPARPVFCIHPVGRTELVLRARFRHRYLRTTRMYGVAGTRPQRHGRVCRARYRRWAAGHVKQIRAIPAGRPLSAAGLVVRRSRRATRWRLQLQQAGQAVTAVVLMGRLSTGPGGRGCTTGTLMILPPNGAGQPCWAIRKEQILANPLRKRSLLRKGSGRTASPSRQRTHPGSYDGDMLLNRGHRGQGPMTQCPPGRGASYVTGHVREVRLPCAHKDMATTRHARPGGGGYGGVAERMWLAIRPRRLTSTSSTHGATGDEIPVPGQHKLRHPPTPTQGRP